MPVRSESEARGLTPKAERRLQASFRSRRGSAADRVQEALAEGIEEGWLEPGSRLGEEALAETFTVSRTPVREAMFRLEAQRLIQRDIHGGASVARITPEQIIELYVVREALDGTAARLAAGRASEFEIRRLRLLNEAMRAAVSEGRLTDMVDMNIDFHDLLATASANSVLADLIGQVHRFVKRFRTTTFSHADRATEAVNEHDALIEAIVAGDKEAAEELARRHMRAALEVRILLEASQAGAR